MAYFCIHFAHAFVYDGAMLFRRYGTFTGGIDLPDEKQATLDKPIRACPPLQRLRVSLAPCGGRPAEMVVQAGQLVRAGDLLARAADSGGVDVRAPLDGRVGPMVSVNLAGHGEFVSTPALELTELSEPPNLTGVPARDEGWNDLSIHELGVRIAEGGLATCRGRVRPLWAWIQQARSQRCRTLIANVMENQPMVTADHRLLVEHGDDVVRGLAMLGRAIEARELVLAVDHRRTAQYRRLLATSRLHKVSRIALSHKYPTGADVILVKILTRRETPPGRSTLDVGAAVIDAATCLAVCHWVLAGRRQVGRVVTVGGSAGQPGNYYVPFGAACRDLVAPWKQALVHGGPMTGLWCEGEAVAAPSTDAVLALTEPAPVVPRPCIRCGWCTDHCPARLNVAMLNDEYELNLLDSSRRAGVMACVECGTCSYICPAWLPLARRMRQLKWAIRLTDARMPLLAGTAT